MAQIAGPCADRGPQRRPTSWRSAGARFWEPGRFDRALGYAVADGLVVQTADGRYAAT